MYSKTVGIAFLALVVCGLISSSVSYSLNGAASRHKRLASDQRMAELQALVSLARGGGFGGSIGHGMFDPYGIGKRSGAHGAAQQSTEGSSSSSGSSASSASSSSAELLLDDKQLVRRVLAALAAEEETK